MRVLPEWIEQVRRAEIVNVVQNDPRSNASELFGVDRSRVFNEIIRGGQADFTSDWQDPRSGRALTPEERALLYGFFNLKGHLVELVEAMRQIFVGADSSTAPTVHDPIVIDVGCGPGTGCLAVANALHGPFTYVGVDRAQAMLDLGERLTASNAARTHLQGVERHWVSELSAVNWTRALGYRPVLIICSYLLASPTINPQDLVDDLVTFLKRVSRGPAYLIYTNAVGADANRHLPAFKAHLENNGFSALCDAQGAVSYGTKQRRFQYAGFFRAQSNVLELED